MFRPDASYRKIALKNNVCAYVFPDGVQLWERREVRQGKYTTMIDINHYWPATIRFDSCDYTGGG